MCRFEGVHDEPRATHRLRAAWPSSDGGRSVCDIATSVGLCVCAYVCVCVSLSVFVCVCGGGGGGGGVGFIRRRPIHLTRSHARPFHFRISRVIHFSCRAPPFNVFFCDILLMHICSILFSVDERQTIPTSSSSLLPVVMMTSSCPMQPLIPAASPSAGVRAPPSPPPSVHTPSPSIDRLRRRRLALCTSIALGKGRVFNDRVGVLARLSGAHLHGTLCLSLPFPTLPLQPGVYPTSPVPHSLLSSPPSRPLHILMLPYDVSCHLRSGFESSPRCW